MPTIVDRAGWGARPPRGVVRIATPTPRLWVHHTASEQHGVAGVRAIQAYHMDSRGWRDIAYSWLVDDDGTIYEGRGTGVAGGHTQGDNSRSHAICLMGDFEKRLPTRSAVDSLVWLARHGAQLGWWYPTLGGHRDASGAQTACPGRHLYLLLGDIRHAVATGGQTEEEDDMALSADDRIWLDAKLTDVRGAVGDTYNLVNIQAGRVLNAMKALGVDEAEIARELAPLIGGQVRAISDADLDAISTAVNDEQHRRSAG
jgi:hypothetical protein